MSFEDYFSSGLRHCEDASEFLARGRNDAAAYLAGYAIECSFKKLIQSHTQHSIRSYGHDLAGMFGPALELAAILAPAARRYRVDTIPSLAFAMAYWNPALRYWTTGDVSPDDAATMVKVAQDVVKNVLVPIVLDGIESAVR